MAQTTRDNDSEPMTDDELVAILRSEEADATSFYTSELATSQSEAMDRYFGALYGNEIDGRSKITTHDIEDTINWMMPDLMRVFLNGDDLVTCTPNKPQDEDNTDCAAQYLEHILFEDNPGSTIIHDFAFDGLLQRLGVVSVMWQDPKPKPAELLEGVSIEQLMRIQADPEYKILEQAEADQTIEPDQPSSYNSPAAPQQQLQGPETGPAGSQTAQQPGQPPQQVAPPQAMPQAPGMPTPGVLMPMGPVPVQAFNLKVQRTPLLGRVHIENVPPEEIALSRRARAFPGQQRGTAQSAGYVRRKQERFLGDVKKEFPDADFDNQIAQAGHNSQDMDSDPRVLSRFQNESVSIGVEVSNSQNRKKVDLFTEYLWIDYDGDGTVELRRIVRVENTILENLAVDDCEYKTWSPIRVAHKAIGRSVADTIIDLQKIRTTIMRLMLDGLSQSLVPRTAVNTQMVDEQGIDDLLDAEIGGVVRVKGDVRMAVQPLINPDVSQSALTAIEYVDQKSEQQSGVTRHAQGIAPDAITKTASGIENLQAAAGERIELVARWLGIALEDVLKRALQLVVAHQDRPRWVKIKGKPLDVDPRTWSDEMGVKVHVGMGGSSRQTQLMNLGAIAAKQEQSIMAGGPQNPVCDVTHLINTYSRMTEVMGFKDATKFWNDPQKAQQMLAQAASQPPTPDPKLAEVQMKGQLAQQELQQKSQAQQQELQQKAQVATQEQAARAQADQVKAAADQQSARAKAESDMIIAREKLAAETQLAREKMQAELALSQEKMRSEMMLAAWEAKHKASMQLKQANDKAMTDGDPAVRMGGKVG
jgi:hypothetical protein